MVDHQRLKSSRKSLLAAHVRRRCPAGVFYLVYPACYQGIGEMDSGGARAPLDRYGTGKWYRSESGAAPSYAGRNLPRAREPAPHFPYVFAVASHNGWLVGDFELAAC